MDLCAAVSSATQRGSRLDAFIIMYAVRGCWSNWGSWSPCLNPSKCNNFNVTRTRSRTCNMPEPGLGFKKDCHGSGTETMVCSGNESNLFPIEVNDSNSSGYNHYSFIFT